MAESNPQSSSARKLALKCLELIVLVLAVYFIYRYLHQSWPEVKSSLDHLNWPLLFVAWLLFLVYFGARSVAWQLILKSLKIDLKFMDSSRIWFLSEFSRYVPGNIWSFLGRVHLSSQKGVSRLTAFISLVIEIIFLLGGTIIFLAVFLWLWPYAHSSDFRWLFILVLPVLIILLTPSLMEKSVNWLLTKAKRPTLDFQFTRTDLVKILCVFAIGWAAYGTASLIVMKSLVPITHISVLWLISGFIVAWLIGYLSFVTPMGLGVREGVIVAMLTPFFTPGIASLIAIMTRIWLIVSELSVLAGIGVILLTRKILTRGDRVVKKEALL